MYTFLRMYPGIFIAKHIILNLSSSVLLMWCPLHVPNEYSVSNPCCCIHRGIVNHNSLIWSDHNNVQGVFDPTRNVSTQSWIFSHYKALVYGCIHKLIHFVCTWITIPNYISVLQFYFTPWILQMDYHVILHIRVGSTQAHPNNCEICSLTEILYTS